MVGPQNLPVSTTNTGVTGTCGHGQILCGFWRLVLRASFLHSKHSYPSHLPISNTQVLDDLGQYLGHPALFTQEGMYLETVACLKSHIKFVHGRSGGRPRTHAFSSYN